jgi:hypothetical protein
VVTHNFHPDRGAFRNVCDLPLDDAEQIIAAIRSEGHAYRKPNYLSRRRRVEEWLIAERSRKLGSTPLLRPIYFFLGNMADNSDLSRPASMVLPLSSFDVSAITFTFPDSMTSCPPLRDTKPPTDPRLGQVFTLDEIKEVVALHGFPDPSVPREVRGADAFIEMQLWDDRPLTDTQKRDWR